MKNNKTLIIKKITMGVFYEENIICDGNYWAVGWMF